MTGEPLPTQTIRELSEEVLLFTHSPSAGQRRMVASAAFLVTLSFAASLPFRHVQLPEVNSFIPVVDTLLALGDVLTAMLLLVQAGTLRSRGLMMLGAGYLFTGLIIIPHALTFPGAFAVGGLLGGGPSSTVWLNIFWHTGLPVATILYIVMKGADARAPLRHAEVRSRLLQCIAGSAGLATALTVLATLGASLLPKLMVDSAAWVPSRLNLAALIPVAASTAALALLFKRGRALIDLWLILVVWAWLLETILAMVSTSRFSVVWYVGRATALCAGLLILVLLLSAIGRLYGRLAQMVTERHRERESRSLTVNAVAAAMVHEIKQPLAAIVAAAGAGLSTLERGPDDKRLLRTLFESIEEGGIAAGHVVDSIRSMFGRGGTQPTLLDLNLLVNDAATLVRDEARNCRVAVILHLPDQPLYLHGDHLQLKHVLLNLFMNAIEAMTPVKDRPRELRVVAMQDAERVIVSVTDSGVGLASADILRVFDPFYTTKPNGTGMGLSLCRSIVETHGGWITAEAAAQHGATFRLSFPFDAGSSDVRRP